MEDTMQPHDGAFITKIEALKWTWGMHNIDKKSMIQKEKLLKELQEAQLELEKLILQTTTNWEGIVMENQTKAILYDQFVEDMSIELANVLKEVQVEM